MKCQNCEEELDVSAFPLRNDRSNRPRPYCKLCSNDIQRSRYSFHKKNNPFKLRCSRAKVRAARLGVPFGLTPEYLEEIWTGKCEINGTPIILYGDRLNENVAELDRLEPNKGYVKDNVAFICRRFNRIKNDGTAEELIKIGEWLKWKLH